MNRIFVSLLVLGWTSLGLQAQSKPQAKPEWERAYEQLERNAAKDLQPLNQLLQNELEAQQKTAAQNQDKAKLAELNLMLNAAQAREERLGQGMMWHPGRQEAGVETFCREAAGKKWTLKGTQQVRYFRLEGRDVVCISSPGRESQQRRGAPLLPGVFVTRRMDGGATVYMVSPDFRQALCLVVSRVHDSIPAAAITNSTRTGDKETAPKNTDLLTFMATDLRNKQHDHEKRLVDLLESQLQEPAKADTANDQDAIMQRLAIHQRALEYFRTPETPPPSAARTFSAAAQQGQSWIFPGMRQGTRLHFEGPLIHTYDALGKEIETTAAEIIWPGLLRMKTASGTTQYIATSPDLRDAQLLLVRSQFPGTLVE